MNEKNKIKVLINTIGWIGTILIISAYTLNSFNYISNKDTIYHLSNLFGAIFMGVKVFSNKNWSNLFLEIFWGIVALTSLISLIY